MSHFSENLAFSAIQRLFKNEWRGNFPSIVLSLIVVVLSFWNAGSGCSPALAKAQPKANFPWPTPLNADKPPQFKCRVVQTYPHDPNAFTQGLIISDGFFYESTGLKGASTIRKVAPLSGRVIKRHLLSNRHFGEGLTRFRDHLFQLTWQAGDVYRYDINTFEIVNKFKWPREGWGITTNGIRLIVSDGSHRLFFLEPDTFSISHTLPVRANDQPVSRLNELEWVAGVILANVWQTDTIAAIDPHSGRVTAWILLDGIIPTPRRGVPNGIAYDEKSKKLYLTGKRWPAIFEVILTVPHR